MRRLYKLGVTAGFVVAAVVPAGLALSHSRAAGQVHTRLTPADEGILLTNTNAVVAGQPASVPAQVAPPVATGPSPSQPTGTPPGVKGDQQDQEGPGDQRDQEGTDVEHESENSNDDASGDPGDPPGADHRCPPDCRSGEKG